MITEFMHPELGREVQSFAGYYIPMEEHLLPCDGREIIYILGHVCVEASCCGQGSWRYVQVPGFSVSKHTKEETAPSVSEVDTVEDETLRRDIVRILTAKYPDAQIEMW